MKAAVVEQKGQPPVYADFPDPVAKGAEQIVAVTAAAISPLVKARAAGLHYSDAAAPPFVAGFDGVGRDEDGARVYFLSARPPFGAMAERVACAHTLLLPDALDDATAAALANPGMSSWAALRARAHFEAGETVLINGATGNSGRLAVQIARRLGAAKVIATGRNAQALKTVLADVAIALTDDAAQERAFDAAFRSGVDVVLDYLWGKSALSLLAAAAKAVAAVRFVQIGAPSGPEITLPGAWLRSAPISLVGSGLGSVPLSQLLVQIDAMFGAAARAPFDFPIETVPLAEVETAWARKESARRLVLTIGA